MSTKPCQAIRSIEPKRRQLSHSFRSLGSVRFGQACHIISDLMKKRGGRDKSYTHLSTKQIDSLGSDSIRAQYLSSLVDEYCALFTTLYVEFTWEII